MLLRTTYNDRIRLNTINTATLSHQQAQLAFINRVMQLPDPSHTPFCLLRETSLLLLLYKKSQILRLGSIISFPQHGTH